MSEPGKSRRIPMPSVSGKQPPRRSLNERTALRHVVIWLIAACLVYAFWIVHEQWSPMHRWNRATADAVIVLLTFTMAIGPGARLWPALRRLLPFRRESGIYATVLALIHATIVLGGWVEWDFVRLFGFEFHPLRNRYLMVQHGFGLANLIGIMALAYGVVLMSISNDRSVHILGAPAWKFLQSSATVLWTLVVVHTAYFLFMHYLDFRRPLPGPNPLRWPFVGLVMFVLALRSAAFIQTWRQRRGIGRSDPRARSSPSS
jgi:methionine sulfoxide reductase heme-binding subunit